MFLAERFQMWQQLVNVTSRGLLELCDDLGSELDALRLRQRVLQQCQRLCFSIFSVGREFTFADVGI